LFLSSILFQVLATDGNGTLLLQSADAFGIDLLKSALGMPTGAPALAAAAPAAAAPAAGGFSFSAAPAAPAAAPAAPAAAPVVAPALHAIALHESQVIFPGAADARAAVLSAIPTLPATGMGVDRTPAIVRASARYVVFLD